MFRRSTIDCFRISLITDLCSSEQHQTLVSHHSVSDENNFKHKCWNLLELCSLSSELDVVQTIFDLTFSFPPQMVADKISIEGAEKVERPDDPVVSLLITLLLLLKYKPMNNSICLLVIYIFHLQMYQSLCNYEHCLLTFLCLLLFMICLSSGGSRGDASSKLSS